MEIKNTTVFQNAPSGVGDFKHVSYLWDDAKAAELAGDEVALACLSFQLIRRRSTADKLWRRQYFL